MFFLRILCLISCVNAIVYCSEQKTRKGEWPRPSSPTHASLSSSKEVHFSEDDYAGYLAGQKVMGICLKVYSQYVTKNGDLTKSMVYPGLHRPMTGMCLAHHKNIPTQLITPFGQLHFAKVKDGLEISKAMQEKLSQALAKQVTLKEVEKAPDIYGIVSIGTAIQPEPLMPVVTDSRHQLQIQPLEGQQIWAAMNKRFNEELEEKRNQSRCWGCREKSKAS